MENPPTLTNTGPGLAGVSPYKFLDFFEDTEADRRRFAGRDREIRELAARITHQRALVLYGRSGLGKTSLLLAGLFPELRSRDHRPVYCRTLTSPLDETRRAIVEQCGLDPALAQLELGELVREATATGPLVIVFDQFEEFFLRFPGKTPRRQDFTRALVGVLRQTELAVKVVFSLREEYLARLDSFAEELPDLFRNRYRLGPLSAFGVRQAISHPLIASGVPYEDAIVSKLLDLLDTFDFDPPVVQILCSELYREAARRAQGAPPRIELRDLERIGGLEGIFRRYLDGMTQSLQAEQHLLARLVLDALITRDRTKRAARISDLLEARFSAEEEEVREVLELLTERRLLRRQTIDGEIWYELIHERIVEILDDWLDLDRRFFEFRQARQFVAANSAGSLWEIQPDALLSAGVLEEQLAPYRRRFRFGERELELVVRSAVVRGAPSLWAWIPRFGLERAVDLVVDLAGSEQDLERLGAASAAGKLGSDDPRLAELCSRLALEDPQEETRRAAAISLAKIASSANITALRAALSEKQVRQRAREALVNLRAAGHPLEELSWLQRWLANFRVRRRTLDEHHVTIRSRWRLGLGAGTPAGAAWVLLPIFLRMAVDALRGGGMALDLLATALATSSYCATLALPLSGLAARRVAKKAALAGHETSWGSALLGSISVFAGAVLVTLPIVNAAPEAMQPWIDGLRLELVSGGETTAVLLVPLLVHGLVALSVAWLRPCVWPGQATRQIWLWSLFGSFGMPLLLPLALALVSPWKALTTALVWSAPAASFGACVVSIALAITARRYPFGEVPAPRPARSRRWLVGVSAAVGLGLFLAFELLLRQG